MNNRIVRSAFAQFFHDLFSGDPVAICIALGLLLFLAVLGALGAWFLWTRKQSADEFRKKRAAKRRKEDEQYKASKKTKEI